MKKLFLILFTAVPALLFAQSKSVLLMNGTLHVGNGEVINNSLVAFKNGEITLVANALTTRVDLSKFDTVINIEGKHVYPGLIGCNSTLGLTEIDAVRATIDFSETQAMNPDVRSQIAYNTDSKIIPTVRSNGILLVQTTPRGGLLSGTSSVMKTAGWNWEDATVKANDGVHLNWPWFTPSRYESEGNRENEYKKTTDALRTFFTEAKAYNALKVYNEKDLRFESMRGLFNNEQTLYIHANGVKEITDAVLFCKEMEIKKICIVGGAQSYLVAGLLNENKVSVMVKRIHELPYSEDGEIDEAFKLPAKLQAAGVLYCIQNEGDQEAANLRNLPFQAGTAVSYGITKEQALTAITLSAAKILGIDKKYGSVEGGKSPTIIVSDGDVLDTKTSNIIMAWINGEKADLNNSQKQQYEKYMDKYGLSK